MFKKLSILSILAITLLAQNITQPKYLVYKETTLSSAAEVITVQQPASGGKIVNFTDAYIYCSVACNPTIEINGTAASATTLAVIPLSNTLNASPTTAWSASNAGVGTVVGKFSIAAGIPYPLDLSGMRMQGNSNTTNMTVRTDSITGTVRIQIRWIEQ